MNLTLKSLAGDFMMVKLRGKGGYAEHSSFSLLKVCVWGVSVTACLRSAGGVLA